MEKEALWIKRKNLTNEDEVFTALKEKDYVEEDLYFSKDNWEIIMTSVSISKKYLLAEFDSAWRDDNPHRSWLTSRKEVKSQEEFINLL